MIHKLYKSIFGDTKTEKASQYVIKSDPELKQGRKYLQDKSYMVKNTKMIEGFRTELYNSKKTGSTSIKQENKSDIEYLRELETKFQSLLKEYQQEYTSYMQSIQSAISKEKNQYNNSNIQTPDGSGYYVNNFGVARWYSGEAWDKRNKTCNTGITHVDTNDLTQLGLTKGPNMGVGEPCGFEGKNINVPTTTLNTEYVGCFADNSKVIGLDKEYGVNLSLDECSQQANTDGYKYIGYHQGNVCYGGNSYPNFGSDTEKCIVTGDHKVGQGIYNSIYELNNIDTGLGQVGYVNKTGTLRPYTNNKIDNVSGTCPSTSSSVSSTTWNAFTKGSEIGVNTICDTSNLGNIDEGGKEKLVSLNQQLINLSETIYNKIISIKQKNKDVNEQIRFEDKYYNKKIQELKHSLKQYNKKSNISTLNGILSDTVLRRKSTDIEYILWTTLAVGVLGATIHHLRK